jgi:hypothetical protein
MLDLRPTAHSPEQGCGSLTGKKVGGGRIWATWRPLEGGMFQRQQEEAPRPWQRQTGRLVALRGRTAVRGGNGL